MSYAAQIEQLIGQTPLVDLSALVDGRATLLGKREAANPGGSVKDRIARAMVDAAEEDGSLAPGGTIIEPTSGNTGIGLAMIAAARGYRMVLVMPETMSVERRKLAASYGAELVLTPGSEGMKGAVAKADELLAQTPGAIVAGQFVNPANPRAHYLTTGPEIWEATDGAVDVLVAGVGTGGTVSGTGRYLKEQKGQVHVVACWRWPSSRPSRPSSRVALRVRTASKVSTRDLFPRPTTRMWWTRWHRLLPTRPLPLSSA